MCVGGGGGGFLLLGPVLTDTQNETKIKKMNIQRAEEKTASYSVYSSTQSGINPRKHVLFTRYILVNPVANSSLS